MDNVNVLDTITYGQNSPQTAAYSRIEPHHLDSVWGAFASIRRGCEMARKPVSKGLRFDVFKRDGFTCQYCGRQPPEVVLELDHIHPVAEGGTNDEMNLVAACWDCNRGKSKKLLGKPQRPDADLAWLETQQEVAELRRYQAGKKEKDELLAAVVKTLQQSWCDFSGLSWAPSSHIVRQILNRYSPETIDDAFCIVSARIVDGYLDGSDGWVQYLWGTLRNMDRGT